MTKNASQGSINQQILPLIEERILSEVPGPPLTASFHGYGNLRSLWEKHVFPPHSEKWLGKWVNYAVDHWEFDCAEERAKLDARTDYYEDGTRWVADLKLISSAAWHRVSPDTIKDGEMKLLCDWQPQ